MDPGYELLFETTIRSFLGEKAYHIAGQAHSEKNRREWYRKVLKIIIKKVHEIDTTTPHKEQLTMWSESSLKSLSERPYSETKFTICLLRLINSLLGFKGLKPYNIATLAYFQTPAQHITDVISSGGDTLQDYYDNQNTIAIRKRLINQLKEEGLSDYHIALALNITEYQVKKLRKNL